MAIDDLIFKWFEQTGQLHKKFSLEEFIVMLFAIATAVIIAGIV